MKRRLTIFCMAIALLTLIPAAAFAGSLNSTAAPGATKSYTLEDIYNRLDTGATATQSTFTEPAAGPTTGTGHTLNQIYDLIDQQPVAAVAKTGAAEAATTTYIEVTYEDGHSGMQKGTAWPNPRFTVSDGTVTDNLTGLIWLANANCTDTISGIDPTASGDKLTWANALTWCAGLADGACGLLDSSNVGDWRLPNRFEMESLLHLGYAGPAVPNIAGTGQGNKDAAVGTGNPFDALRTSDYYWTSTTYAGNTSRAWHRPGRRLRERQRQDESRIICCRSGRTVMLWCFDALGALTGGVGGVPPQRAIFF